MGEKSDKKVSSPYVVLENRPLDQWKVTELKEELKKRKLMTKGLKEDLVKRLDEVVRAEMDEAKRNLEIELNSEAQPEVQSDNVAEETVGMDHTGGEKTDVEMGLDIVHADDGLQSLAEKMASEGEGEGEGGVFSTQVESFKLVQEMSVETTTTTTVLFSEESVGGLNQQPRNEESKPEPWSLEEGAAPGSSDLMSGNEVVEVSKVQSDSISIDTITNIEKNEIKDTVIADDVKLEIDVKPSKSKSVEVDGHHMDEAPAEDKYVKNFESIDAFSKKSHVVADDVKSELDVKVAVEEKYVNNPESVDISKKNDCGDVGSSEKLNLDRSSGDDSMEEDGLESKQIDSKFSSDEVKFEVKEDDSVHAMVEDATADKNFVPIEGKTDPSATSLKRKPHDQEAAENCEIVKRQRRWNTEGVKVPEQHSANQSASTTPKDAFQTLTKRTFSRSESKISQEVPKGRVVPPSSKPPTTSLRIDHFLRPFTLKAVQELLGKTGTVVSFWMDQIKTHCYVTYASEEEAIETRNAVCNLQWPVNGGRLLMADFVDPQEVKNRVDPPPPSPAPPVTTVPPATTIQPPQPSPGVKQQLPPPPSLPPPPPLSNPPAARNRAVPPPPSPEKIDPPILTLDDLFKKTRATPRIYYLPLSDEQVAAKLSAQGKPVKQ